MPYLGVLMVLVLANVTSACVKRTGDAFATQARLPRWAHVACVPRLRKRQSIERTHAVPQNLCRISNRTYLYWSGNQARCIASFVTTPPARSPLAPPLLHGFGDFKLFCNSAVAVCDPALLIFVALVLSSLSLQFCNARVLTLLSQGRPVVP